MLAQTRYPSKPSLLLLLAGLATLFSCQQESTTGPKDNGPFVVSQTWDVESVRKPDSATWSHKGTNGTFQLSQVDSKSFKVSASFAQPIVSDTLEISLWRLGLRTTIASTIVQEDGQVSVVNGKRNIDSKAIELLTSFDSLRGLDPTSYGSASDPVATQILSLRKATAFLIHTGRRSIQTLPVGMDSTAVVAQILILGAKSGSSLVVLATTIGIDAASLKTLAEALLKNGDLKSTDSSALFPPMPVRVGTALSIASPLVAGGPAVSVQGSFAWNKGYRVSNNYQVKSSEGSATGFQFLIQKPIQLSDTIWSLTDNFLLQAPATATAGTDTLVVTLSDDSGHVATARAIFQVIAKELPKPDTVAPAISLLTPKADTSVPNSVQTLNVEVAATDSVGIDSVKINGVKITAAPFKVSVPLAIGANPVVAQAWDKAGNASKTISVNIVRANSPGDTVPPRISRSSPSGKDTAVGYLSATATLAYIVTDDSLLSSVSLEGTPLASNTGLYQTVVNLPVGTKSFVLLALDKHGNPARDTVSITRQKDTTKPVLTLAGPYKDTIVSYKTTTLSVSVSATDIAGIDSVRVDGVKSASTASPYVVPVSLKPGANTLSIEAFDKFGIRTAMSLVVTRASATDSIAPSIQRVSPIKDTATVGATTATYELSWTVSDDSTVASVTLNGTPLTSVAGKFSSTQALSAGTNVFTLEAKDARGNTKPDVVKITRLTDPSKTIATWQGNVAKDTSVWAFVPSVTLAWKVTDNALKLVTINGAPVGGTNGLYSQTVTLATDTTWVRLMALDSSSNTLWDSVRVMRKYDKTAPTVAFQKAPSRIVANAVTADTMVWTVSDNLKMASVKVNGTAVSPTGNTYTFTIANLAVGTHRYSLVATDSAGNATTDNVVIARTALPPTHSAAAGRYIGTVYDTLSSPGADSIMYSTDLSRWQKANGPVAVSASKTLYAKAMPGDQVTTVNYVVSRIKKVAPAGSIWVQSAYTVFVMEDGAVWGAGAAYGVYSGAYSGGNFDTAVKLPHSAIDLSVGNYQAFYLQSDKRWLAAGQNIAGNLGIGYADNTSPLSAVDLDGVQQIAVGNGATYFRRADGSVWGAGEIAGNLGVAPIPTDGVPVQIQGLAHIADIKAGYLQSDVLFSVAAVDSAGNLYAWGQENPTPMLLLTGVRSISFENTLIALMLDGTVQGVGVNTEGQIGSGTTRETGIQFSQSLEVSNIKSVAAGRFNTLFLKQDGTLYASGMVPDSILGYCQYTGPLRLTPVVIDANVDAIWSAGDINFYRRTDGTLWAMGSGFFGNGFNGTTATPRRVNF